VILTYRIVLEQYLETNMPSTTISFSESDVVRLILEFMANRELRISMLSLERETGVINGVFSDDLLFLRQLILDGQWDDAVDFVQPLGSVDGFDMVRFRYAVCRHKYLELLCVRADAAPGCDAVAVEEVRLITWLGLGFESIMRDSMIRHIEKHNLVKKIPFNIDSNRNTKNIKIIKIAVVNANLCGRNMRYAHFAEICEKCGNMRNICQSYICVKLTCLSKHCLDKFWSEQDVLYNYGIKQNPDLRGIGNHSIAV